MKTNDPHRTDRDKPEQLEIEQALQAFGATERASRQQAPDLEQRIMVAIQAEPLPSKAVRGAWGLVAAAAAVVMITWITWLIPGQKQDVADAPSPPDSGVVANRPAQPTNSINVASATPNPVHSQDTNALIDVIARMAGPSVSLTPLADRINELPPTKLMADARQGMRTLGENLFAPVAAAGRIVAAPRVEVPGILFGVRHTETDQSSVVQDQTPAAELGTN